MKHHHCQTTTHSTDLLQNSLTTDEWKSNAYLSQVSRKRKNRRARKRKQTTSRQHTRAYTSLSLFTPQRQFKCVLCFFSEQRGSLCHPDGTDDTSTGSLLCLLLKEGEQAQLSPCLSTWHRWRIKLCNPTLLGSHSISSSLLLLLFCVVVLAQPPQHAEQDALRV